MKVTDLSNTMEALNIVVQPFPIYFDCNDYHVMLYLKGHPEYESMEAFILEREEGGPYIRIIITRLDQTQIDHINDQSEVDKLKAGKRNREICYTPIQYDKSAQKGKTRIILKFTSFKGENVVFDFYPAAPASTKHTKLIDPGGHSRQTSLPVMYPEKTTLAGPKSKIMINGSKFKIPVKIWIPLFFKGMKGYYSELFNIGVIRAGKEPWKLLQKPRTISIGEKWIYDAGGALQVYEITGIENELVTIKKDNEVITAKVSPKSFELIGISVFAALTNRFNAEYCLKFDPALPIYMAAGHPPKAEVNFSISVNKHLFLVKGVAKREKIGNLIKLSLIPQEPEWSTKRPVSILIEEQESLLRVNTEIVS